MEHRNEPSSTTIASLGEDILLEIFLRLPSLATLVRAALTCRGWRSAVASSPAFRRRFRELHPAPLLGLFFASPSVLQDPTLPVFPSFVPARRRDRDLAAVVRGGDFFLTSIQEHRDLAHSWDIDDCRGGYVLVRNGDQKTLAVINPLARQSERFFDFGHEDTLQDSRGYPVCDDNACLICSDEEPSSFRVVLIAHDESRVRATFFSSDTGEWSICPWVDLPVKPGRGKFWLLRSMQANGSLYFMYKNRKHMLMLDTATWEFSVAEVPRCLRNRRCSFLVGETNNGAPCIVYAINFEVGMLLRGTDAGGLERWMTDRVVPLNTELGKILGRQIDYYDMLVILAVRDGFAYLATSKFNHHLIPSWFFSLCLRTMKLEILFERTNDTAVHPCVMPWPSSLVGNHGRFAPEHVSENA